MTKKGYKKRLPTVLAPPVPRPRSSPEAESPPPVIPESQPVLAAAPRGLPEWVVGTSAGLLGMLICLGLIFVVLDGPQDPPAGRGPTIADTTAPPVPLAGDESYVETRVLANGAIDVHQWIHAGVPLRRLRLALPEVAGAASLYASRVQVVADGVVVAGPASITDRAATYTFDETTNVQVRYRLVGAVERSDSTVGRALAVATSLQVRYAPQPARETRVVRATEVLSLACSPSPEEPLVPCGQADGASQWHVGLTGPRVADRVVAQLNLD